MTRSSPGVKRMAAVLDFMADHPGQAFALTDLVRALKLSRATCHALLTGLVEVGYLYRTTDKTYVLGPALLRIGAVAAQHVSPLQIARPEMRQLADDYDVVCTALFLEGDAIVSRERAASVSHVGYSLPLGTRVPLRARSMVPFFAWHPEAAKALLDRFAPAPSPEERAHAEAAMAFTRAHGFNIHVRNTTPAGGEVYGEGGELPAYQLEAIAPEQTYPLSSLTAPVFAGAGGSSGGQGRVEFVLGLMGFNRAMSGAEILAVGERLTAACARISDFLAGKPAEG